MRADLWGRVVLYFGEKLGKDHFEEANKGLLPCVENDSFAFQVEETSRKLDSFPMWSRIAMYREEESLNPSPFGD